jgi:aminoglycoside phosphotransferase
MLDVRRPGSATQSTNRNGLVELVRELTPGGRLVRTRRLRGGVGARMHVLDIERADGTRIKVSLRRFIPEHRFAAPDHVAHEYRTLQLVQEVGIPAPRPLLPDADGRLFGVPAIVMSYLPGRAVHEPQLLGSWADELASILLRVHEVTPHNADLSSLHVFLQDGMREEIARRAEETHEAGTLAREVHATLADGLDCIAWPEATLVHDDYWPGNVIFRSGHAVGIVDWSNAEVGDPRADVSECRIALALWPGGDAPDVFSDAYRMRSPQPVEDIWYFDLFRGLRALLYHEKWLPGVHDAGITTLTPSMARERIEAFLRRALAGRDSSRRTISKRLE